jgi:hypothetical protein
MIATADVFVYRVVLTSPDKKQHIYIERGCRNRDEAIEKATAEYVSQYHNYNLSGFTATLVDTSL